MISKVSSTPMPHIYAQRHAEREIEREWKWEVGKINERGRSRREGESWGEKS